MDTNNVSNVTNVNEKSLNKKKPVILSPEDKKHLVYFRLFIIISIFVLVLLGLIIYQIYGLVVR